MLGKQTYSGVPYGAAGKFLAVAIMILFLAIMSIIVGGPQKELKNMGLVFGSIMAFLDIFLFYYALDHLRARTLEFDDSGVRWKKGRKIRWEIPWGQILKIGTVREVRRVYTTHGIHEEISSIFLIETGQRSYRINAEREFGQIQKLKEAFRVLCWRCMNTNIRLEDGLGWASDYMAKFADHGAPGGW